MGDIPSSSEARRIGCVFFVKERAVKEINRLIEEKLRQYPEDVAELALAAIELCEKLPYQTVSEQLETVVRRIVGDKGHTQ